LGEGLWAPRQGQPDRGPHENEAAYDRTDLFDRWRELMDTWTKFATAKPADVVAIRA
jgi:hypothetical protein